MTNSLSASLSVTDIASLLASREFLDLRERVGPVHQIVARHELGDFLPLRIADLRHESLHQRAQIGVAISVMIELERIPLPLPCADPPRLGAASWPSSSSEISNPPILNFAPAVAAACRREQAPANSRFGSRQSGMRAGESVRGLERQSRTS